MKRNDHLNYTMLSERRRPPVRRPAWL